MIENNNYKEYSDKELETLKRLLQTGLDYQKIAFVLKRTKGSIKATAFKNDWIKLRPNSTNKNHPPKDWNKKTGDGHFVENRRKWKVSNRILYGILLVNDITIAEFSKLIGVSARSVQRWIYEGAKPNKENTKKICKILNISKQIIFGDCAYKTNEKLKNSNKEQSKID